MAEVFPEGNMENQPAAVSQKRVIVDLTASNLSEAPKKTDNVPRHEIILRQDGLSQGSTSRGSDPWVALLSRTGSHPHPGPPPHPQRRHLPVRYQVRASRRPRPLLQRRARRMGGGSERSHRLGRNR